MNQQDVFGRMCRDQISREKGVCVGVIDWMFGCRYYLLQPRVGKKAGADKEKEISVPEKCLEIIEPEPVLSYPFPEEETPRFFGKICRDKVTGYEGMCIGRLWAFYSEKQYYLQGKYNKKKMMRAPMLWVDEGRIEVLESADEISPEEVCTEHRGGVRDVMLPAFL